jgi:hypothetical protein
MADQIRSDRILYDLICAILSCTLYCTVYELERIDLKEKAWNVKILRNIDDKWFQRQKFV